MEKLSNKALKGYNKCINGKKSVHKLNLKCEKVYKELKEAVVDYSEDWDIIVDYLESKNENISWYHGF